ncbi:MULTISPECIES: adenylate/guanylate cyclase domain-containing protein [unclassified Sinorhizobium]|uniref:adenylate/guanylate cyclase domain-containing protein n=1 Tax=unclassified Sinorhizobium TaxID=2613772 RepID=UPI003524C369
MNETRRKLTTIFCADVQDYTRMMGADEERTLATLKRYRDAMARLIAAHDGRVVNTWGDGLIAEFSSVVEAVRAAVDIQNELAGLNAMSPADGRMLFRIGINLGDVIIEGEDLYGDGVNIAARLQTSAKAGGIVISSTVYEQVRNKVAVGFDFLGSLMVKNVAEGVPSYAVRIGEASDDAPPQEGQRAPEPRRNPQGGQEVPAAAESRFRAIGRRLPGILGLIGAALIVINLLTWEGTFWAVWPILGLAAAAGLYWAWEQSEIDRSLAAFTVIGIGIVAVNLLTWHGTFWAIWPLLAFAFAIGIRWVARR